MIILQLIVTIATLVAIGSGIPQLLKLMRLKNSEEFNVGTWLMWCATQLASISYAVAIQDGLLVALNGLWLTFYGMMAVLILRYHPKVIAPVTSPAEQPTDANR